MTKQRLAEYAAKKAKSQKFRREIFSSNFGFVFFDFRTGSNRQECNRPRCEQKPIFSIVGLNETARIAFSFVQVKPWDDETDMVELERLVRTIEIDGLLWGGSRFVPLAFGIKKLQINCVVEDDKVKLFL